VTHIKLTRHDLYGRTKPVYYPTCLYHLKSCHNDHGKAYVHVTESNDLGELYFMATFSYQQETALVADDDDMMMS